MSTDPRIEEPSCLAFSRQDIRAGKASPVIRGLVDIIDSQKRRLDALAAADKAATIGGATSRNETAAVIEGLPDGTVVADTTDDVFQLRGGLWCSYESVPLTGFQLAKYAPITILRHGGTE